MHILYLDESGTHDARYFVAAGIAVFERLTHYLARQHPFAQPLNFVIPRRQPRNLKCPPLIPLEIFRFLPAVGMTSRRG